MNRLILAALLGISLGSGAVAAKGKGRHPCRAGELHARLGGRSLALVQARVRFRVRRRLRHVPVNEAARGRMTGAGRRGTVAAAVITIRGGDS